MRGWNGFFNFFFLFGEDFFKLVFNCFIGFFYVFFDFGK